jgi:hypothetical protein
MAGRPALPTVIYMTEASKLAKHYRPAVAVGLALTVLAACGSRSTSASSPITATTNSNQPPQLVQVSHDQYSAHAEPAVAANPKDRNNLLAASMVYQGTARGVATYASFDGGRTWRDNGLLPGSTLDYDGDVTVTFDHAGAGFVSAAVGSRVQSSGYVWRTDDEGRHFDPPVVALPGDVDHPGLAADPSPDSSDLYLAGIASVGSPNGGLRFTRSTDGGRSFEPARDIDPSGGRDDRLSVVAAGPNALVAVAYYSEPPGNSVTVNVTTSTDNGVSFAAPVSLGPVQWSLSSPGLNLKTGPTIAVDPVSGDIYVSVATVAPTGGGSEVKVFASHDLGRSWSAPTVAAVSSSANYFHPQLTVDARGAVGLEAFELAGRRVQLLLWVSTSKGSSFGTPRPVMPSPGFDPALGLSVGSGPSAAHWIGDYQGLAAAASSFHPLWNDTRTGQMELFTATMPAR